MKIDMRTFAQWAGLENTMRYHIKREFLTDSRQHCSVLPGTYLVYRDSGGAMRNGLVTLTNGKRKYTVDEFDFRRGKERGWIKKASLKECA
jgi:hypothetical protein